MFLNTIARAAAGALVFLMSLMAAWGLGRRDGDRAASARISEEDRRNARKIEVRADAARAAPAAPVERLRKAGRLRD